MHFLHDAPPRGVNRLLQLRIIPEPSLFNHATTNKIYRGVGFVSMHHPAASWEKSAEPFLWYLATIALPPIFLHSMR
jgi:hypothetical protein